MKNESFSIKCTLILYEIATQFPNRMYVILKMSQKMLLLFQVSQSRVRLRTTRPGWHRYEKATKAVLLQKTRRCSRSSPLHLLVPSVVLHINSKKSWPQKVPPYAPESFSSLVLASLLAIRPLQISSFVSLSSLLLRFLISLFVFLKSNFFIGPILYVFFRFYFTSYAINPDGLVYKESLQDAIRHGRTPKIDETKNDVFFINSIVEKRTQ